MSTTTTATATLLVETLGRIDRRNVTAATTIGRDAARNTIVIDHPTVSRAHARIIHDGDTWRFEDLGSQNGSAVDNQPMKGTAPLTEGCELHIGRVRAWFFACEVPANWQPGDVPQLEGKLFRCRCGHIGWAPLHTAGMTLNCVACGREIVMRDAPPAMPQPAAAVEECAACHTPIGAGEAFQTCPDCGATAHADCWRENRGCATYGCSQANVLDHGGGSVAISEAAPAATQPTSRRRWFGLWRGDAK